MNSPDIDLQLKIAEHFLSCEFLQSLADKIGTGNISIQVNINQGKIKNAFVQCGYSVVPERQLVENANG